MEVRRSGCTRQASARVSTWPSSVKYNVLPLDERRIEPFNSDLAGRPVLVESNSQILYGGMGRLSENSVINLKNKSHSVTAELVVPYAGGQGVIIAQGAFRLLLTVDQMNSTWGRVAVAQAAGSEMATGGSRLRRPESRQDRSSTGAVAAVHPFGTMPATPPTP